MPNPGEILPSFDEITAALPDVAQVGNEIIEQTGATPFGAELLTDTPTTPERLSLAACIRSGVADSNADDTTVSPPYDYSIGFDNYNRPTVYEVTEIS